MPLHTERLDEGWLFFCGDDALDLGGTHQASFSEHDIYLFTHEKKQNVSDCINLQKAGKSFGPASPQFTLDAHRWSRVDLPHDYQLQGTYAPDANYKNSFLKSKVAWYRRLVHIPAECANKKVFIHFAGVYRNATVFVNGHLAHENESGYLGFTVDADAYLNFGEDNLIAVRVDPCKKEFWSYEGAGIYRHVDLIVCAKTYIPEDGVAIRSQLKLGQPASASIDIDVDLRHDADTPARVRLDAALIDPEGQQQTSVQVSVELNGLAGRASLSMELADAWLWSLEQPQLYTLQLTLTDKHGDVLDRREVRTGFRESRFDGEKGYFLNGEPVKVKGVNMHQDHAGFGIALPDELQRLRLEKLLAMGCNAIRTAHHPPDPFLLELCDEMGILVMPEHRLVNQSPAVLTDLRRLIKRDRNHPCVFIWSLGNEEMEIQFKDVGRRLLERMRREVRALDATRPCTVAVNIQWHTDAGFARVVDVFGGNYLNHGDPDKLHARYPERPILLTEAACVKGTRGCYEEDAANFRLSCYDRITGVYPPWASSAEDTWKTVASRPFMAGQFVWTGMDYRGEPTPFSDRFPVILAYNGPMDYCGLPKDTYYYYKAWWTDEPVLHLFPHWNWHGREGQPINVWCHTNCDTVELFLNGKSLGTKTVEHLSHVEWDVPYEPGTLTAVAKRKGQTLRRVVTTAGPAHALVLTPNRTDFSVAHDLIEVIVSAVDKEGQPVPLADNLVEFTVTGGAAIGGTGNGNPTSLENDKAPRRKLFNGLAVVYVAMANASGPCELTATSDGLISASVRLSAEVSTTQPVIA